MILHDYIDVILLTESIKFNVPTMQYTGDSMQFISTEVPEGTDTTHLDTIGPECLGFPRPLSMTNSR